MFDERILGLAGPIDVAALREYIDSERDQLRTGYSFPFTTNLALSLLRQGRRLAVFACDESLSTPTSWQGDRLTIDVVPRRSDYRERARDLFAVERDHLATAMANRNVAIINPHWSYEFAQASFAARKPTVVTVHDWAPAILRHKPDFYRLRRLQMQRDVFRRGDHFTAPSPYVAEKVARVVSNLVTVIPNGVTLDPRSRATGAVREYLTFGALNSGWDKRKNVSTLLRAFGGVRRVRPSAELHLAGEGYEVGGPAHQWAARHGLDIGVTFRGRLPHSEVRSFLSSLDLFVHPSREESFGMVLIEAIATGTAVLGGDRSGAVPWVIGVENTANVRSHQALKSAMLRFRPRSNSESETLSKRFDIDLVARQYSNLFDDLIGRTSSP